MVTRECRENRSGESDLADGLQVHQEEDEGTARELGGNWLSVAAAALRVTSISL